MTTRWIAALASVMLSIGCGGGTGDSATETAGTEEAMGAAELETEDLDGCDYVTQEQVSGALGSSVGEGQDYALSGCEWKAESGTRVALQVFAGSMFVPATCNAQKQLVTGREEEIAGLGDSALWGSSGNLVVCISQAVVRVDIDDSPNAPSDDREVAATIARAALERMAG